jgi:hypothetical protein
LSFISPIDKILVENNEKFVKAEVVQMLEEKRSASGAIKRRRHTEEMYAATKKTTPLNGSGNHEL